MRIKVTGSKRLMKKLTILEGKVKGLKSKNLMKQTIKKVRENIQQPSPGQRSKYGGYLSDHPGQLVENVYGRQERKGFSILVVAYHTTEGGDTVDYAQIIERGCRPRTRYHKRGKWMSMKDMFKIRDIAEKRGRRLPMMELKHRMRLKRMSPMVFKGEKGTGWAYALKTVGIKPRRYMAKTIKWLEKKCPDHFRAETTKMLRESGFRISFKGMR